MQMMICENAERCEIIECPEITEHEHSDGCDYECRYYGAIEGSKCIEVKESKMTILEKLEELKNKYEDFATDDVSLYIADAIQIVRDSLPTKEEITDLFYKIDGENRNGSHVLDCVDVFRILVGLKESPKRYKWESVSMITKEKFTKEEFEKTTMFKNGQIWEKVKEEV